MARPQNSPKGLFAKDRIDVGTNQITGNSTALILNAGIKISNAQTLTANSTGFLPTTVSSLPGNVQFDGFAWLKNSTGVFAAMINTTGTTWKYLNVTTKLPT